MNDTTIPFRSVPSLEALARPEYGSEVRKIFGRGSNLDVGGEAFQVTKFPGHVAKAHFHDVDQFQVFFGGAGSFYQRHPIHSPMLHYADAYTTYGPFGSGPEEPLVFYTLRAVPSTLKAVMPGSHHLLPYVGRRHYEVDLSEACRLDPSARGTQTRVVIAPEDDGLAAIVVTLGTEATFEMPALALGIARCFCVAAGNVSVDGEQFGMHSLGWRRPGEPSPVLRATEQGASVLVLDFPSPTQAALAQ